MKTLAILGVVAVATLSALLVRQSGRPSGENTGAGISITDLARSPTPMVSSDITDYSLEFPQVR